MIVVWRPSPNFGSSARGVPGRLNVAIRAEVKHRIVGSLQSAINVFMDPNRQASTHFGIGLLNGVTTVVQFVDLSDMAWGNGDVSNPTWSRYRAGENPNLSTVSTEHEDGGEPNRGRISDATWTRSMDLSRLLRSGDVAAIRAAGIHVRDVSTVAQLASLPIDTGSYIDHHQIAGPNKPFCLRRWLDDPGFVEGSPSRRDQLLAYLSGETDMPVITRPVREQWNVPAGMTFWVGGPGFGEQKSFLTAETLWSNGETLDGKWRRLEYHDSPDLGEELWADGARATRKMQPIPGTRNPATGYGEPSLADCTVPVNTAKQMTADKANAQMDAWTANRPVIVP